MIELLYLSGLTPLKLDTTFERIEIYLKPLRKYLSRLNTTIEDQIKSRKALLISLIDYIIFKNNYIRQAEDFLEIRKNFTNKNGRIGYTFKWV